jgi:hypothetical protein
VAYADGITLLVTDPKDISALAYILRRYEKATGAIFNIWKSKAMAAGSWDTTVNIMDIGRNSSRLAQHFNNLYQKVKIMDIPYCTEMNFLGFQFSSLVGQSGKSSWTKVTGVFIAMAREVYGRDLCFTQRIK